MESFQSMGVCSKLIRLANDDLLALNEQILINDFKTHNFGKIKSALSSFQRFLIVFSDKTVRQCEYFRNVLNDLDPIEKITNGIVYLNDRSSSTINNAAKALREDAIKPLRREEDFLTDYLTDLGVLLKLGGRENHCFKKRITDGVLGNNPCFWRSNSPQEIIKDIVDFCVEKNPSSEYRYTQSDH